MRNLQSAGEAVERGWLWSSTFCLCIHDLCSSPMGAKRVPSLIREGQGGLLWVDDHKIAATASKHYCDSASGLERVNQGRVNYDERSRVV